MYVEEGSWRFPLSVFCCPVTQHEQQVAKIYLACMTCFGGSLCYPCTPNLTGHISLQSHSLDDTLKDMAGHYSRTVNSHNMVIQQLEAELADVHAQVTKQGSEYQALLNIKSKLEEEIATYHSLLEGTGVPSDSVADPRLPEIDNLSGVATQEDVNIENAGPQDVIINNNGVGGSNER